MTYTIIDVDDLPVEVPVDEYEADPEGLVESIRAARAAIVGELDDDPAPDYDELEAVAAAQGPVPE